MEFLYFYLDAAGPSAYFDPNDDSIVKLEMQFKTAAESAGTIRKSQFPSKICDDRVINPADSAAVEEIDHGIPANIQGVE